MVFYVSGIGVGMEEEWTPPPPPDDPQEASPDLPGEDGGFYRREPYLLKDSWQGKAQEASRGRLRDRSSWEKVNS